MSNVCRYCGAKLDSAAMICTNCGKVVPAYNSSAKKQGYDQFGTPRQDQGAARDTVKTPYAATRSARQMQGVESGYADTGKRRSSAPAGYDPVKAAQQQKVPFVTNASSGKRQNTSTLAPLVFNLIKILIVVAILYAGFVFVRVMLVKQAKYDFKLAEGMTLASKNYGQAFDNYFKEGKWWYDFEKNIVTYEGTTSEGKVYKMTFGKVDGQTAVKTLYIDDKKIDNADGNIMKNYVLGMFMSEKEITSKAKAFR